MKIECISKEAKELILSKIFIAEYRAVMELVLEGYSQTQIEKKLYFYSLRQIQRIITKCWREVCIMLAEDLRGDKG